MTSPVVTPTTLLLSAATADALDEVRAALADHLERHPDLDLGDVAGTLRRGRRRHVHRLAVPATSVADAVTRLRAARVDPGRIAGPGRGVALLLPGQGVQRAGAYRHLYAQEPAFARAVDACAESFAAHLDTDVRELLFDTAAADRTERLSRTEYTQPAVFTLGTALAALLHDRGVEPVALLGHSIGELTAAHLAGVFDLPTACRVVAERGRLVQGMEPGVMAQVPLAEATVRELLEDVAGVEICAVNAPLLTVVGGRRAAVLAWLGTVDEAEAPLLAVSHAFHTATMDPAALAFADVVVAAAPRPPRYAVVSNVTGRLLTDAEATDPGYWARQLRSTVRFADGLATLGALTDPSVGLLIDAGSRGFAARVAASTIRDQPIVQIASAAEPSGQAAAFAATLGTLWEYGAAVDPPVGPRAARQPRRLRLPTYPFARDRHWIDPAGSAAVPAAEVTESAAPRLDPDRWFWAPSWSAVDATGDPPPTGPWVVLAPDTALGRTLVAALREHYTDVRVAWSGAELELGARECRADPGERDHHEQVLRSLGAGVTPAGVVYAWGLDGPGFHDTLRFAQACGAVLADGPAVRVHVLTRGAIAATPGDDVVAERAMALGVARVLPLEVATLDTQVVDLDPAGDAGSGLAATFALAEATVALRGGVPHIQRFDPVPVPDGPAPVRAGATYLVTGGLGGVGTAVARWLGSHGARVLLIGRRAAEDVADALTALTSAGVDATYAQADVTSSADLARAVAQPVHGVFHCAGLAGEALIATLQPSLADRVLAPKVAGTRALDAAVVTEDTDFVVLCSSHNAILGRFGQADYCAANAFLDAVTAERRPGRTRWISADLDVWSGAGMAVDTTLPDALRIWRETTFGHALRPEDAATVFTGVLAAGPAQVVVSTRDFGEVAVGHTADEQDRLRHALAHVRQSKPVRAVVRSGRGPGDGLAVRVADVWRDLLGIDDIAPDESFLDLGGHSLVATMMLARLRSDLGVRLPLRDFMARPTIAAIVERVEGAADEPVDDPFARLAPVSRGTAAVPPPATVAVTPALATAVREPRLSLMFFSAVAPADPAADPYALLIDGARFADRAGLHAVWLPERHFQAFGGLFPNPAVLAAVLARETTTVRLRAGSVISPLHAATRIAEEWAVVDRLSGGRVDLSFGSGWHIDDFVLAPRSYADRKPRMWADIDTVRALWRGEQITLPNGAGVDVAVHTYPAPMQPDLQVWVTGESEGTFEDAGRRGLHILTATMHQTREQLVEHIGAYRAARAGAGHDPTTGTVTLMQHTYVDPAFDARHARVRDSYTDYIRANVALQTAGVRGFGAARADVSEEDVRILADRNLDRLIGGGGLIGTPDDCARTVAELVDAGVDEIAALVDFLPDAELVLGALTHLPEMWSAARALTGVGATRG